MLVLNRQSDQSLTVFLPDGQQMLIRLKDIRGQSLRVVIDAPPEVRIVRTELLSRPGFDPLAPPLAPASAS